MDTEAAAASPQGKSTVPHTIYGVIRERIIDGTYAQGARLTEQSFADEFATSRTPVREAMRMLAAEGYVDFKPNSGTIVRTWTLDQILEIFRLRASLEAEISGHAALHITQEQIARLQVLQEDIERNGLDLSEENANRIGKLNRQFHDLIATASHQERMVAVLAKAIEVPVVHRTFRTYDTRQLRRSFYQHRELIDAFIAHDEQWAKSVMRCHIHAAKNAILESFRTRDSRA
jgi:DNA-binding GntR family transcriptional regulator